MSSKVFAVYELRKCIFDEVRKNNFKKLKNLFEQKYKNIPKIKHRRDFFGDILTIVEIKILNSEKHFHIMYLRRLCFINGFRSFFWMKYPQEKYNLNLDTNSYEKY